MKANQRAKLVDAIEAALQAAELRAQDELDLRRREEADARRAESSSEVPVTQKVGGSSHATTLVTLAIEDGVVLWHTADGEAYATISEQDHVEHWPVKMRTFRRWLARLFFAQEGKAPGGQALQDALGVLEGKAVFEGEEHAVHVRLAATPNAIYLDLADAEWRVVEISREGWRVLSNSPVKFRRARGMLPLPVPTTCGDLRELRRFLNVGDDGQFTLMVSWLVGTFMPKGPYPLLELDGEQGSAKSTTSRMLRRLVDPNEADLRSTPRDERNLVIAARNGHIVGFDNLSGVHDWVSDALCRIATGAGFGTRELFSDCDEIIFSGARPIVCNGIGGVASRPDLLDRTIRVILPQIREEDRKDENTQLWPSFYEARPRLLGVILDSVSTALRRVDKVKLERRPRMADFARWVVAAEPSLPWKPGDFMDAYGGNREAANELALEASPIAVALMEWFAEKAEWTGTATALLGELAGVAGEKVTNGKSGGWPKAGNKLSQALRRLAPNLRAVGIDVRLDFPLGRGRRKSRGILIRKIGESIVPTVPNAPGSSPLSPVSLGEAIHGDDGDDTNGRPPERSHNESDQRERESIQAVELEAERTARGLP